MSNRAAALVVAVTLLTAACSGTAEDDTLTISSPDATAPVETVPPATAPTTASTTTTAPVSSTTTPGTGLRLFEEEIQLEGLTAGFASVSQEALVNQRLEPVADGLRAWITRTLTSPSGGGEVIGVIAAPVPSLVGVPGVSREVADEVHAEPTESIEIAGQAVTRSFSNQRWWYYWHSNSRLFIAVGDAGPAEEAISAMIAGHDDRLWEPGDCLLFDPPQLSSMPNAPFGGDNIVECDQPHTVEVTGSATLDDGRDAGFPGAEIGGRSRAFCDRAFDEYIGGSSRRSDLGQISYLPNEAEWLEGDRYLACIVFTQDTEGDPAVTDRSYADAGPEFAIVPDVGDCYSGGSEAPCTAVHDTDYLGSVDFPLDSYPPYSEAVEASNEACRNFADDTIIARDVPDARVFVFTTPFSAYEFELGWQLDCYASVLDSSGSRLGYRGSILDGTWSAVGPGEGGLEA